MNPNFNTGFIERNKKIILISVALLIILIFLAAYLIIRPTANESPSFSNDVATPSISAQPITSPPTPTELPEPTATPPLTPWPTWMLPENNNVEFKSTDRYEIEVEGNIEVSISDRHSRLTGIRRGSPFQEQGIPLVQFYAQTESEYPNLIFRNSKIIGVTPQLSELFTLDFGFNDTYTEHYPSTIKIYTRDSTIDLEKTGGTMADIYSDRTQLVIYHDLTPPVGSLGKLGFAPQSKPETYQLAITDANTQMVSNINPTYILKGKQSQDYEGPLTKLEITGSGGQRFAVLNATDDSSGVHKILYTFDRGSTLNTYGEPILISGHEGQLLGYVSVDKAGNYESIAQERQL